jgi:Tol biopolymer transport system component
MTLKTLLAVVVAAVVAHLAPVTGALARTNPSLGWMTISTEHFDVNFHPGEEWTAEQVAKIAEEIRPYINGVYQYDPGRVDFIIKDTEDYANGAAYYYDNKIEIWATNLEFGLRGTTQWLRNVVTHEYTHIVSIGASMKMPRRIPALYFQAISFEEEKRPDVLYGYPNAIVSYPFVGTIMPPWFAEGVAQYQSPSMKTDCWDSHRDMILRAAIVDDEMLSYEEMGHFGHGSLGNEQVYDHGYGLVNYIAKTHGPASIDSITHELGRFYRLSMDGALKKVTGKSGKQLYADWKDALRERYKVQLERVRANPREGRVLFEGGNMTISPSFSPDGKRVVFLSNKGSDYARTSLYIIDRDGKNARELKPGVTSRPVFSPDGTKILYARHRRTSKYNEMQSDLHVYDIETKKETRLTEKLRAAQPSYSPDGRRIACVLNSDGTNRIAVMDADGKNVRVIFEREKGTQFYNPEYSPRGDEILFGIFETGTRHIAVIDTAGENFMYLVKSQNDERDARWLPDGSGIVFSSDRTGIFNVYTMQLGARHYEQLTNVVGGAFAADVASTGGALVYAGYSGEGYHVSIVDGGAAPVAELDDASYFERSLGARDECANLKAWNEPPAVASADAPVGGNEVSTVANVGSAGQDVSLEGSDETPTTPGGLPEPKKYGWKYSDLQFFPRLVIWDGKPRVGAFLAGNEILDKQFFFLGGSYGFDGRFDGFVNFELRNLFPILYMEFVRMREITSDYIELEPGDYFDALNLEEIRYDLWAGDIGVRLEFQDPYNLITQNDFSIWYSHSEYRVHIDWKGVENGQETTLDPVAWRYFIGNDLLARWRFKSIKLNTDASINPRGGREFMLQYMHAWDQLFVSGDFLYGFRPDFTDFNFNQYTVDWREYIPMPWFRHTLQLRAYGSFIDRSVDDFFWVYLGGLDGIRGYTYYSVGGRQGAMVSGTYRFPLLRNIGRQLSWLTFRDVYGGVFFEAAKAWENHFDFNDLKRSVGGELRVLLGSYYSYPTAINFVAARSLDRSVFYLPSFEQATIHEPQWRYYLQVGFTF